MYDRDRLAPVTLTGEYPVTQLIIDSLVTDTSLLNHFRRFFFQYGRFHTIPLARVDHRAGCLGIRLSHVLDLFAIFCDNLDDRDIKFLCKLEVTVIVCRYAHDSACTVVS